MKRFVLAPFRKPVFLSLFFLLGFYLLFAYDSTSKYSNSWSIGFRFKNPSGISLKKNWGANGLEITLGRSNPWNYNAYSIFRKEKAFKNFHFSGYEPIYRPWNVQVHYLVHRNSEIFPGVKSYYGFGPQLNSFAFDYSYYYSDGSQVIYENKIIYRTTLGADALIGAEYTFRRIPLSLFADVTAYIEMIGYPLYTRIRTGWGFRVSF